MGSNLTTLTFSFWRKRLWRYGRYNPMVGCVDQTYCSAHCIDHFSVFGLQARWKLHAKQACRQSRQQLSRPYSKNYQPSWLWIKKRFSSSANSSCGVGWAWGMGGHGPSWQEWKVQVTEHRGISDRAWVGQHAQLLLICHYFQLFPWVATIVKAYESRSASWVPSRSLICFFLTTFLKETNFLPSRPVKAFLFQVVVLANHQNGRDAHIRQIRIFEPE